LNISHFAVTPYSISFVKPLQTARKTYTHREGLWLQLQWEDYIGIGEAAPLDGFSRENIKEVNYALEGFHQAIDGENFDSDDLLSLVNIHTEDIPSARFALETAVFDLLSQESKKPLAGFLNPKSKSQVSINGIVGIHPPSDGFTIMKDKVGFRNLFDEIEHLEYLAQSFGEETMFRLDANCAFDLPKAIRFCKEMEAFNIDYIEQPLPLDNLEDISELRYHTEIPIAVDESLTDFHSAEKIIEMQAADVFVIKPMVSGGFGESKKIIQLARDEDIRTVVTSSLENSIGRMACLHLTLANEITEACGLATGTLFNEDSITPIIKNGTMEIPVIPGLGIEL